LPSERARGIAIKRDKVPNEEAIEDGVQQKRVFGWFTQCFCLLNQRTGLIERSLRLGRSVSLGMHQSICERDLKLDLFAT
jgi:hypothetical protein